jgi:hypothetical protein
MIRDQPNASCHSDLMSVNLHRLFNEQNRRRRAAAIRAMYAKDCFFADESEPVSGWGGVSDKVDRWHAIHSFLNILTKKRPLDSAKTQKVERQA